MSLRFGLVLSCLLALSSCDGGTSPADAHMVGMDAPTVDDSGAPASDAASLDLDASAEDARGTSDDVAVANDASVSDDAAAVASDAAGDAGCPRTEMTRMAGVCDGRGRAICQMWSDSLGGGRMTNAVCLGTGGFCARADTCASPDPESCTCGAGPRCADDQVCVFGPMRTPHCECISP